MNHKALELALEILIQDLENHVLGLTVLQAPHRTSTRSGRAYEAERLIFRSAELWQRLPGRGSFLHLPMRIRSSISPKGAEQVDAFP